MPFPPQGKIHGVQALEFGHEANIKSMNPVIPDHASRFAPTRFLNARLENDYEGDSMNVLEIYPNFAWWLEGANKAQIEQLRDAAQIQSPGEQSAAFERLSPAKAYYLVGDAVSFDLIPGVFDEVVVRYSPTALKRLVLTEHIQSWLAPGGQGRFESVFPPEQEPVPEDYGPLRPHFKLR